MENEVEQITVGDVVQLKSGGPKMTADFWNNQDHFTCKWFEGSELKTGSFAPSSLIKIN